MTDATDPTAGHAGQLQRLARRGTVSVIGAGFSGLFGVALVVIVTNGFSREVAGTLFAATAAFLILESVALLGTDTGLVRWLPTQLASGRAGDVRRTLAVAIGPVLGFSLCVGAATYALAPTLAPWLVGDAQAGTMTGMLRVLAIVLPVAALHDLVVAATRGAGSMRPTVVVENIGRLGLQSLLVLLAWLSDGSPTVLALAWSFAYVPGLLASSFWLSRLVRRRARGQVATTGWADVAREFWSYTAARGIARVTQTALKRSDIVMVAALAGPAEAALYTAASRFIVLGQLFVQSVQQALSPQMSTLFARGDDRAANAVFQAATRWSMIASWPLYLVLAAFAPALMDVFGDGYSVASEVVVILSLTMLLATACGPVDAVLLMAGRSWLSLRNSTVALAVNVGLNLVLIPLDGIRGAAVAWSVAIVVRNVLPLVQVRRQLDMWPVTRPAVRVGAAAVGCFGAVGVVMALRDPGLVADASLTAVALAAYLALVWSWRETLGLAAFRSALRRPAVATPRMPAGT
ncbi:polysaccharide biosynthesis C-terminal domain-containing protein [Nocardioides sp. J2M5]|uniref:oligosaccharide flippase family protein n=1 Tax=Nocardioides palaemonis TaxID=2829810 RepID=UPI001BA4C7B7|nr:polysaccharide biosynthesis C-terminal domain-containing protein [Nocardioides palaemonis]MBS2936695.1 polysaccharide biosynthesis C-terminal domain-containing protein [Nocardioides palaemonis]